MISTEDAKYILSEIRSIPYYERQIAYLNYQLSEYDMMIADATNPVSPNSGKDVVVNGKTIRMKFHSTSNTSVSERIADYITAQKPLEKSLQEFRSRHDHAVEYRQRLKRTNYKEFVEDFFNGKSYRELQDKYYISNAYDKMIRIIVQTIPKV